jgi:outer membrane receptor protein involved in Fe transport
MPTDRQYQMVMSILPGAIEGNNPSMNGSAGSDNMYLMDGMTSVDPMTTTWSTAINFDNIQEVQVTTGGISAEYGRGTGALVNMLTKSGSNQFHGTVRAHVTDTDWNSEAKPGNYYFDDATRYITEDRWSFNLGGPIARDHLWFFVSYEDRGKTKPTSVWAGPDDLMNAADTGDLAGNITQSDTPYEGHYAQAKATWSPNSSNTFMVQYMDDPIDIPNLYSYIGYNSRGEGADVLREQGGYNVMATWTGILTDNAFLDAKFNAKRNSLNNLPTGSGTTYRLSNSAGTVYYGNATSDYRTNRNYDVVSGAWSQFVDDLAGDHNFKFGLEWFDITNDYYSESYPGNEYLRYYSDGETPYYRYVWTQRRGWLTTTNTSWTVFAQDSWMVTSRLTLNLGLRFENMVEQTPQGYKGLDWDFGDRFQPRLGFAYALGSKGDSNLHGSYGRYHDTFGNYVTRTFVVSPNSQYYLQYWDTTNNEWDLDRTYYYDVGAANADQFVLDSPYMDEFTLGYEGRLTDTMSWSVDAIWRTWEKGIEDDDGQLFNEFPDNPPDDGNYVFTNLGKYREYQGLQFTLRKRLGGGKYQFLASYTYSDTESLWGNEDYASVYADNPFNYYNWWGRPPMDLTHMAKLNGSWFLPAGFMVGTNFTYWSGQPYTIYVDVQTSPGSEWDGVEFGNYYPEPRGSREYDATYRWDLRAEWNIALGKGFNFGLYVDIFNVTNAQPVVATYNYAGVLEIDQPGQQIDNNGNPVDFSDFEPEPDEWQAPRSYFFGAKIEF